MTYAINTSSLKVHALVCELLAAICIVSSKDGHKAVLAALSDFRVVHDENFRFETLLSSLRIPGVDGGAGSGLFSGHDEDGVWEARVAVMALVNAITNCPENLEDRVVLREELSRRGLNELIVVSYYPEYRKFLWNSSFLGSAIHRTSRFAIDTTQPLYGRKIRG
jgi:diaphanous 1